MRCKQHSSHESVLGLGGAHKYWMVQVQPANWAALGWAGFQGMKDLSHLPHGAQISLPSSAEGLRHLADCPQHPGE